LTYYLIIYSNYNYISYNIFLTSLDFDLSDSSLSISTINVLLILD